MSVVVLALAGCLQGDQAACSKPPVDTKAQVAFQYMSVILKRNFCFDGNGRFGTSCMVTL